MCPVQLHPLAGVGVEVGDLRGGRQTERSVFISLQFLDLLPRRVRLCVRPVDVAWVDRRKLEAVA